MMAEYVKALQEARKGKAPAPIEYQAPVHAPNCDCHKRHLSSETVSLPQNKKIKPSPPTYIPPFMLHQAGPSDLLATNTVTDDCHLNKKAIAAPVPTFNPFQEIKAILEMRKDLEEGVVGDDGERCRYCYENDGFDYWSYKKDNREELCGDCVETVQENSCLKCGELYMWEDEDKLSEEGSCWDCSMRCVFEEVLRHTVELVSSQPTEGL
jgi:hypothetical protein